MKVATLKEFAEAARHACEMLAGFLKIVPWDDLEGDAGDDAGAMRCADDVAGYANTVNGAIKRFHDVLLDAIEDAEEDDGDNEAGDQVPPWWAPPPKFHATYAAPEQVFKRVEFKFDHSSCDCTEHGAHGECKPETARVDKVADDEDSARAQQAKRCDKGDCDHREAEELCVVYDDESTRGGEA